MSKWIDRGKVERLELQAWQNLPARFDVALAKASDRGEEIFLGIGELVYAGERRVNLANVRGDIEILRREGERIPRSSTLRSFGDKVADRELAFANRQIESEIFLIQS